jgi:hypothetical protein
LIVLAATYQEYLKRKGTNKDIYNPDSGMTRGAFEKTLSGYPGIASPFSLPGGFNAGTNLSDFSPVSDTSTDIKYGPWKNNTEAKTEDTDMSALGGMVIPGTGSTKSSDPFAEKINSILDQILAFNNTSDTYDVTTDPLYAPLKQQYESAGQSAFNNQIGRLSALTGGRPSTAAVGTATGAQNEYMQEFSGTVLPSLVQQAYERGQDKYNNLVSALTQLQNMSNTEYSRGRDIVSDTGYTTDANGNKVSTLAGTQARQTITSNEQANLKQQAATLAAANYNDIQAYINTLPEGDPLIHFLQAERQKKIDAQKIEKTVAEQEAYERATAKEKYELDKRYTEAQIADMKSDNSRAWAELNESQGTKADQKKRDDQYNSEFTKMMSATDPAVYLNSVKASLYPEVYTSLKSIINNDAKTQGVSTSEKITAIADDLSTMTPQEAYGELTTYSSDYIKDLGTVEYNRLLGIYTELSGNK